MDTIVINNKMYEIRHTKTYKCTGCLFHTKERNCKAKGIGLNCLLDSFIFVRRIYFFERIKIWFKKKINKNIEKL